MPVERPWRSEASVPHLTGRRPHDAARDCARKAHAFAHQRHGEAALRVQIVFVDADKRLCVARLSAAEFFLLETTGRHSSRCGDTLSASFAVNAMADVFNETRGSLLQMKVLKRCTRLDEAIRAAKVFEGGRASRLVR